MNSFGFAIEAIVYDILSEFLFLLRFLTCPKKAYLRVHFHYFYSWSDMYGLERGIPYEELSEEDKRGRKHMDKVTLEAERQAKLAIAEAKKQKAEIEAETAVVLQHNDSLLVVVGLALPSINTISIVIGQSDSQRKPDSLMIQFKTSSPLLTKCHAVQH